MLLLSGIFRIQEGGWGSFNRKRRNEDGGRGCGRDRDGGAGAGCSSRSLLTLTCHSLTDCSLPGLFVLRGSRYCLESSS